MTSETYCQACSNLPGCELVQTQGECDQDKLLTLENPGECGSWSQLDQTDLRIRARVVEYCGIGGLRAINQAPSILQSSMYEDEDMTAEVPDFAGMIHEGMTNLERDHQLRFEQAESGDEFPRNSFPLRRYASDPDGPLAKTPDVVMFWSVDQLIKELIKSEIEAGWITKAKKPKKKKEEPMGRTILINKASGGPKLGGGSKAPGKALGGKVASPATAKKKAPKKAAPAPKAPSNGHADPTDLLELVAQALGPILEEITALRQENAALSEAIEAVSAKVSATSERSTKVTTVLHDILISKTTEGEENFKKEALLHGGGTLLDYLPEDEQGNI